MRMPSSMVIMTTTFSGSFFRPGSLDLSWEECYGKIYLFFRVVVWNIFIRKLSHLTISSAFILVIKKCIKTTVAFE